MRRLACIVTLLVAGVLAASASAQVNVNRIGAEVISDVAGDGQLEPCDYTTEELQALINDLPADVLQYGGDVRAAIRAAINARAAGACDEDSGTGPAGPAATATPAPTATATPGGRDVVGSTPVPTQTIIPEPPGPDAQMAFAPSTTPPVDDGPIGRPGNDAPTPLLLLGLLAVGGLVALAVVRGGSRIGVREGPLASVRHAWREAAWRFGGGWESFRDWVRTGR